jgi:hypothetical protein
VFPKTRRRINTARTKIANTEGRLGAVIVMIKLNELRKIEIIFESDEDLEGRGETIGESPPRLMRPAEW